MRDRTERERPITPLMLAILRACVEGGGTAYVNGPEIHSARLLELRHLGDFNHCYVAPAFTINPRGRAALTEP